jgi:hypothetical protein
MMSAGNHRGWHQVAFERDVTADVTRAAIGEQPLVLVRSGDSLRCFSATCPHRGADLGLGSCAGGEAIICPFHGFRIGLQGPGDHGFHATEFHSLVWGGMIFVRLTDEHENGLMAFLRARYPGQCFVPGFQMPAPIPAELVIENGFDAAHFRTVHGISNEPDFTITRMGHALVAAGVFEISSTQAHSSSTGEAMLRIPYVARAFSPGLIISEMGGIKPYSVVTAATPDAQGGCTIRLTLILPDDDDHLVERSKYLLEQSRLGLESDRRIWQSIPARAPFRATERDRSVLAFREFCRRMTIDSASGD